MYFGIVWLIVDWKASTTGFNSETDVFMLWLWRLYKWDRHTFSCTVKHTGVATSFQLQYYKSIQGWRPRFSCTVKHTGVATSFQLHCKAYRGGDLVSVAL